MLLHALNQLYERLAGDTAYEIPPPGYSSQRISFCIVIKPDGTFCAIDDVREVPASSPGKKTNPKPVTPLKLVLGNGKPSGQGLNPCFLWDNSAYMLGYKTDDPKPERTAQAFDAFRQKHLDLEKQIACPEYSAICRFLEKWTPARALENDNKAKLDEYAATGFGVFQIQGRPKYIHEHPDIRSWWEKQQNSNDDQEAAGSEGAVTGQCLITGETAPLAQLHEPAIKGVTGAQSSGAKIVSFNCDSFVSYGKEQSLNAPVSKRAAFRYANALNALTSGPQSSRHRIQIGGDTFVFWAEGNGAAVFESLFAELLGSTPPETTIAQTLDENLRSRLSLFLDMLRQGGGGRITELGASPDSRYYIVGLAPNASRIFVRYFFTDTLAHLVENLKAHYDALRIARPAHISEFPTARQILNTTAIARKRSDGRAEPDFETVLTHFDGALLRAILARAPYPAGLYFAILQRIRADGDIAPLRAAFIKACLNRNHHQNLTMSLDSTRTDTAYLLGRLFAVLEKAQAEAQPGINATVKDRFYSAASATPASVFPRIIRTSQHHLAKLERPHRIHFEKRIQEIMSGIEKFPRQLSLEEQGLFAIGYYHQRQDFFTPNEAKEPAALETAEA